MFDYILFIVIKKADFSTSFLVRYNRFRPVATAGFVDAVGYVGLLNGKVFEQFFDLRRVV